VQTGTTDRPREALRVEPASGLRGTLHVPGDKSITHRAYLLGGLARGTSRVKNPNPGLDCEASLKAMELLGAEVVRAGAEVRITGVDGLVGEPDQVIDCGNSGTSIRLLAGILAGGPGLAVLTGDASLRSRPMKRVIEPLGRMGARISSRADGRAPLAIRGAALKGMTYRLPVASAQVKSALLLAGLKASGRTAVEEATATRDHTERMLRAFGVPVEVSANKDGTTEVAVEGGARLAAAELDVPGDPSAAAFFLVAALVLPGSEVVIEHVAMNPTRRGVIDALIEMGGEIELRGLTDDGFEPVATVVARSSRLRAIELAGERIPALIDELPALAVAAAYAEGTTVVRDAGELRVKESDRIDLVCRSLAAAGVRVEERADGFVVHGGPRPHGATIDALGDHRIAMSMAVLGLGASGPVEIQGAEGIPTSFPDFAEQLGSVRPLR
jgi:3-phosphoshikimate 1-carboxyvinyltransferase